MTSRPVAISAALLGGLLLLVGAVLALMGGAVLIPQTSAVIVLGVVGIAFLGVQLLVFRAIGLRSRADDEQAVEEQGREWRAWRG